VDVVKQWMAGLGTLSLFGVYSVRIINKIDRCTREAQDTPHLPRPDETRPCVPRSPENEVLAAFLARRWGH
jgi:hypothetical protein